jgi:polar amino acid transport system permease protein
MTESIDLARMRVVPLRRPGLWVASAVGAVAFVLLAVSVWRNPNIDHAAIAHYQFAPAILAGLRTTLLIALASELVGLVLGTLLAVGLMSDSWVLRMGSRLYVWLLRGTPLLVQIIVWGNLALLFPHLGP